MVSVDVVYGLGGGHEALSLVCEPAALVSSVKHAIQQTWQVPSDVAKLVHFDSVLQDDHAIEDHCSDGKLFLNMVVSYEHILREMDSTNHLSAMAGRETLVKLARSGKIGEQAAFVAMCTWLEDTKVARRRTAITVLPRIVQKGFVPAVDSMIRCLADADAHNRHCAVRALSEVCHTGDQSAIAALCSVLHNQHVGVAPGHSEEPAIFDELRIEVLQTLERICDKGNQRAVDAVIACLKDGRWSDAPCAAVRTLACISRTGHTEAIKSVCDLLRSANEEIRLEAVHAISSMAAGTEAYAVEALRPLLDDPVRQIGQLVMDVLSKFDENARCPCRPPQQNNADAIAAALALAYAGVPPTSKGKGKGKRNRGDVGKGRGR